MENIYLLMIIALAVLAAVDLVVGVSNDAVNFLNSALGSKAISFRTIMIVASLGIAVGAIFSSGLMEVARKGIFNPGEFMFDEIIVIFMAVMITDILLLDFFNTVGMPTSTTVSIVFELLGAAVAMALLKIADNNGSFTEVVNYINTTKAAQIIGGILLSVVVLLLLAILLLVRNYVSHKNNSEATKAEDSLKRAESSSVQGVIQESATNISRVIKRGKNIYSNAIKGLAKQDLALLKKSKSNVVKLSDEIDDLRDNIFYFIKNVDESSIKASNFYINVLGYLQDMIQSLEYIAKVTYKDVNNNHKKLKNNQIKDLDQIEAKLAEVFEKLKAAFDAQSFDEIQGVLKSKQDTYGLLSENIREQVRRTITEESSPKHTSLYFSVLLETKDLMDATFHLLEEYHLAHDDSIQPAIPSNEKDAESPE
jgi:phosphate/sulfate permease